MTLSVQDPSVATTDFETEFGDQLTLSQEAQNLLFRDARTANTFTDEPISDEQVKANCDLAKWAPTSLNNQPLRILLARSSQARERLLQTMSDGNKATTATAPLAPTP